MADFESQALPFRIRVLEGDLAAAELQGGQPPGVLELSARALPQRPLRIRGKMRHRTTFYPGSPNATQQPIGPVLEPTTVTGMWMDRYLGDGQAYVLMSLIEQIRDRGSSVEVSWGAPLSGTTDAPSVGSGGVVRVGLITDAEFQIDRPTDVSWSIEFTWRSTGRPAAPVVAATARFGPKEEATAAAADAALAAAYWEAYRDGPVLRQFGLPQQVRAAVDGAFEAVAAATTGIEEGAARIAEVTTVPLHQARALVGACEGAIASLDRASSGILAVVPLALEVRDSALDLVRNAADRFLLLGQISRAQERGAILRDGVLEAADPDVLAEVRAPAGTDLRDLSIQFYGTPDLWFAIALANGISGSAVPSPPAGPSDDPARPLRIPRQQVATDMRGLC